MPRSAAGRVPRGADAGPAAARGVALTSRVAMMYRHDSDERQEATADVLSGQAAMELGRVTGSHEPEENKATQPDFPMAVDMSDCR
jgi:hypothetical protein